MGRNSNGNIRNIEVLRTLRKRGRFSIIAYVLNAHASRYISVGIHRNGVKFSGYLLRSMSYSVVCLTRFFFFFAGFGPFSQIQSRIYIHVHVPIGHDNLQSLTSEGDTPT